MKSKKYYWQVAPHPKGLGFIVIEWINNKKSTWKSGNFATEELAQSRMLARQELIESSPESVRKLNRSEINRLFGKTTFPKRKQLN